MCQRQRDERKAAGDFKQMEQRRRRHHHDANNTRSIFDVFEDQKQEWGAYHDDIIPWDGSPR